MADSLLIDGIIELLAGGQVSTLPTCAGATFYVAKDTSFSLGVPQPQVSVLGPLLLDGEKPVGERASNRTVVLPVVISVTRTENLATDRATLAGARETLFLTCNQEQFPLRWTRDGGIPLVFDCFRAEPAVVDYNLIKGRALISNVTLTMEAQPYGHTLDPQVITFAAPVQGGGSPPASPVTIDSYTTVSSTTQGSLWSQVARAVVGTYSAKWDWSDSNHDTDPQYSRNLPATVDITGRPKLSWWFGLGTENYKKWHEGNVTFKVTLTDNASHKITFGGAQRCYASNSPSAPTWQQVSFSIPQAVSGFDYTHVSKYSIEAWRFIGLDGGGELDSNAYLNGLIAAGGTTGTPATNRGTVYQLLGVDGSARAPVSMTIQQGANPQAQGTSWASAGTYYWRVPAGVYAVKYRCKGAIGAGGQRTTAGAAGGAGGGAGAGDNAYPVSPGDVVAVVVGAAGTDGASPADGATSSFDGNPAPGGKSVPPNTVTGGLGGVWPLPQKLASPVNDFEGGLGSWVAVANAALATAGSPVHGGSGSMSLTSAAAGDMTARHCSAASIITDGIAAGPLQTVTASAWFTTASISRTCSTGVEFYDSAGTIIGAATFGPGADNTPGSWIQAKVTTDAPAGAAYCCVALRVQATAGAAEVHYADDVTLGTGSGYNGGRGADGGTGGAGANWLTGNTATFEGTTGGWTGSGNCTTTYSTTYARTGTGSLRLASGASGGMNAAHCTAGNILTQGMPCSPGDSIAVAAYLRAGATGRSVQAGAQFYDSAGTSLGSVMGSSVSDATGSFTLISGTVTAPANSAYCRAYFTVLATGGINEYHYLDDASLAITTAAAAGGGGGSTAGDDAVGTSATGQTGAVAPTGGISGGNGGAAGGNNAGAAGGGGAVSTGSTVAGGAGKDGKVQLWWTSTLSPFHSFIAHRPGPKSPAALVPIIPAGNGTDVPDGREYTVPAFAPGVNARFYGTYTVIVSAFSWANTGTARDITVTFKQYEYSGGPSVSVPVVKTFTPNAPGVGEGNGLCIIDNVTLPISDLAPDNADAYFTVGVTSGQSGDRIYDVVLIDTSGQFVLVNLQSGSGYPTFWIDEPDPNEAWGRIIGSAYDRSTAVSVLGSTIATGGPPMVDPGTSLLVMYSAEGQPGVELYVRNRWWVDVPLLAGS